MRCVSSPHIIENPNGAVRNVTRRIGRWRDPQMVLRWATAACLHIRVNVLVVAPQRGGKPPGGLETAALLAAPAVTMVAFASLVVVADHASARSGSTIVQ